ncbi:hypothetical protein BpHYR1_019265 [Brachionus plicatilis]|uniref:G-protein coupled receptors family 1 profile domain-containing protein n=1 Tax=Brachionus plicatilis TaxID=10195 RepID=A0A3M7PED6_BRAPC|nr:hypothetical protein BpHYR1_019265 [Brachionus plicatilis]
MSEKAIAVQYYFSITTMPLGILLNILSMWIFSRKRFNKNTNMGFLYIILCLFNIIALINQLIIYTLEKFEIDPRNFNLFSCKFYNIFASVALQIPSIAQIYISYDLYRSICNFKAKILSKKYYYFAILLSILGLFATNSIYFTFFIATDSISDETLIDLNSTRLNSTITECIGTEITDLIGDGVNILFRDLVPFTIIFILNYSVTKQVLKSKKNTQLGKSLKKEYNFAITVIAINIVFLLIYLPWAISFVLYHTMHFMSFTIEVDLDLFDMIQSISNCVSYLNNYSPFFINIIFNSMFRDEFMSLLPRSKRVKSEKV